MDKRQVLITLIASLISVAHGQDLCKVNPYTTAEADRGRVLFDSHCAFCHQTNLTGRQPGNSDNESPSFSVLSATDVAFVDNAGGVVPPLIGPQFFDKYNNKKTFVEFSSFVSGAANSFPPAGKIEMPQTFLEIAAYVLFRNCAKS